MWYNEEMSSLKKVSENPSKEKPLLSPDEDFDRFDDVQSTTQEKVSQVLRKISPNTKNDPETDQLNLVFDLIDDFEDAPDKIAQTISAQADHFAPELHPKMIILLNEEGIFVPDLHPFSGIWESPSMWENVFQIGEKVPAYYDYFQNHKDELIKISPSFKKLSEKEQKYAYKMLHSLKATKEDWDQIQDPEKKTENRKDLEVKSTIDQIFVRYMLEKSKKINEGEQGSIHLIDVSDLTQSILEHEGGEIHFEEEKYRDYLDQKLLTFFGVDSRSEKRVIKMLKIFNEEKGDAEYEAQKIAYHLTPKDTRYAQVPQIYKSNADYEILKNPALKDSLEKQGILSSEGLYYMIMDYVEGQDFYTYLLGKVLEKEGHPREEIQKHSFEEMLEKVKQILPWEEVNYQKVASPADEEREQQEVGKKNFYTLKKYCQKKDIKIPASITEKVEKTLKKWHENDFYHRDLHARNVMLELDENGNPLEPYIIDFGSSKKISSLEKPYEDEHQKYRRDENILPLLEGI